MAKVNEEGNLANDYPSLYDGNEKSEMFWKGSGTRVQFSDETKQRQYMSNFFQILNPNSVGPISDTQRTEPLQEEESYNFHGDGWFNNMCWNHVSMKHSESRNDALKNWALAVVWLQLELDATQDSLLNPDDRIEFRHFDRYCRDAVTFMKSEMNLDSSDDELDSEMDSIVTAKLYRFQAVTQRFPAARAYIIASTMNNFVDNSPWQTTESPLDSKNWYKILQNSKEDLPNLKGSCYIDHYPPLLYRLLSPFRNRRCNLNQGETKSVNKALRILLAGDTSVIQSSKAQALRVAKKILQGSEIENDEAKKMARLLSLPYISFQNLVGLVRGSSWHLQRFL